MQHTLFYAISTISNKLGGTVKPVEEEGDSVNEPITMMSVEQPLALAESAKEYKTSSIRGLGIKNIKISTRGIYSTTIKGFE